MTTSNSAAGSTADSRFEQTPRTQPPNPFARALSAAVKAAFGLMSIAVTLAAPLREPARALSVPRASVWVGGRPRLPYIAAQQREDRDGDERQGFAGGGECGGAAAAAGRGPGNAGPRQCVAGRCARPVGGRGERQDQG